MPDQGDPTETRPYPTSVQPYGRSDGRGVVPVAAAAPQRPPRRRHNPLPTILVVLLVLVGLVIAADRLGVRLAERTAADELTSQLGLTSAPAVDIEGIPFLTQLAGSTFDHVVLDADGVPIDSTGATTQLDHLHLDLRTVHSSQDYQRFDIERADGWAQLGWSAVSALGGGVDVGFDSVDASGQGRVKIAVSQAVLGQQVRADVVATPHLDTATQTVTFSDPVIAMFGIELPAALSEALISTFLKEIPLTTPFGLAATGLTVTADGARIDLAGENLTVGE